MTYRVSSFTPGWSLAIAGAAAPFDSIIIDGNSLAQGQPSPFDLKDPATIVAQLMQINTSTNMMNFGTPGSYTSQNDFRASQSSGVAFINGASGSLQTGPGLDFIRGTAGFRNPILWMWEIGNDIVLNNVSAAAAEANYQTYFQNRVAAGWPKTSLIAVTVPPRGDCTGANETTRVAVNTWLRAHYANFAFTLADLDALVALGTFTNLNYYEPDQVHHTPLGYTVIGYETFHQMITAGMWTLTQPAFTSGVIDGVSNVIQAYGTRKLKTGATKAVQILGTTDIGFLGNSIDVMAVWAVDQTGIAQISKIYDQSGSGNDAVFGAGHRPWLQLSALKTLPVVQCLSSMDMFGGCTLGASPADMSIHGVYQINAQGAWGYGQPSNGAVLYTDGTNIVLTSGYFPTLTITDSFNPTHINAYIPGSLIGNTIRLDVDGTVVTAASTANVPSQTNFGLCNLNNGDFYNLTGLICEHIGMSVDDHAGTGPSISSNQRTYWGTP